MIQCCNPCQGPAVNLCGTVTGVGGAVANLPIEATINGTTRTVMTDANGRYCVAVPQGAAVTIRPVVGLGVTVSPARHIRTPACASADGLDFTLSPVAPPQTTYTVSGALTGIAGAMGQIIQYTVNGQLLTTTTDVLGGYSFTVPAGAAVTITPPAIGNATVTPTSITLAAVNANTPNQNFTYTPLTASVTVSGTLSNALGILPFANVQYTIDGVTNTVATNAAGMYSFTATTGSTVSIQPAGQTGYTATPPSRTITSIGSNTVGQDFTLATAANFGLVSGTVSGLADNSNRIITYLANAVTQTVRTGIGGTYSFPAPSTGTVQITPPTVSGFTPTPAVINQNNIGTGGIANQNFVYA